MAAFKTSLFVFLLVAAVAVIPLAESQGGLLTGLLSLIRIQGYVFCTATGNAGAGGVSATPVFSNATVQLVCGTLGSVVSSATTNEAGAFSIVLDPVQYILSSLLSNCKLLVKTPLSVCDPNLSALTGVLTSALKFIGNSFLGLLSITHVIPVGFSLTN